MNMVVTSHYLDLIRRGDKTTTIRAWPTCRISPGDPITVVDYRSSARVRCTTIEQRLVRDLTDIDAHVDGFTSLSALRTALKKHYPTLTGTSRVWIVRFALLDESVEDRLVIA